MNSNQASTSTKKKTDKNVGHYKCGYKKRRICKETDIKFVNLQKLNSQIRPFKIEDVQYEGNPCRFKYSDTRKSCKSYLDAQLKDKYNKYNHISDDNDTNVTEINLDDGGFQCDVIEATLKLPLQPTTINTNDLNENLKDTITLISFLEIQTKIYFKKLFYIYKNSTPYEIRCFCAIFYENNTNCNLFEVFSALFSEIEDFKNVLLESKTQKTFTEFSDAILIFITRFFQTCASLTKIDSKNLAMFNYFYITPSKLSPLQNNLNFDLYLIDALVDFYEEILEIVKALEPADLLPKENLKTAALKRIKKLLEKAECIEKPDNTEKDKCTSLTTNKHKDTSEASNSSSTLEQSRYLKLLPQNEQSKNSYFIESNDSLAHRPGLPDNLEDLYPTSLSEKYICNYGPNYSPLEIFFIISVVVLFIFAPACRPQNRD